MITRAMKCTIYMMLFIVVIAGCNTNSKTNPENEQEQLQDVNDPQLGTPEQENRDEENPSTDQFPDRSDEQSQGSSEQQDEQDFVAAQIDNMTLGEKIGQLFIVGMEGTSAGERTETMLNTYHVGGIILYSKNIEDAPQTLNLLNELKRMNESNPIPLFLTIDQEGGKVSRLPKEIAPFPGNAEIGRLNDEQLAFQIGQMLAEALIAFGFNMNYAPVLDINSNPQNPVIGERSYGAEAELVTKLGIQTMLGMQSKQVIPVVKHFPGHGDTTVDSHEQLPIIEKSLHELHQLELVPFIEAADQGADAVMVAHILMSQMDPEFPASMSEAIMSKQLREELGFKGVIITDDMTMGGITENYDVAEAAVLSLLAGSDIIMVAHGFDQAVRAYDAVKQAVETGKISESTINEKVYRVVALKQKYELNDDQIEQVNVDRLNERIHDVLSRMK